MDDIVIVSAARTPVGSFNGALSTIHAHDLGALAHLDRAAVEGDPAVKRMGFRAPLLSMPAVGADEDFEFKRDVPRPSESA